MRRASAAIMAPAVLLAAAALAVGCGVIPADKQAAMAETGELNCAAGFAAIEAAIVEGDGMIEAPLPQKFDGVRFFRSFDMKRIYFLSTPDTPGHPIAYWRIKTADGQKEGGCPFSGVRGAEALLSRLEGAELPQ